jgi:hypothetical protein
MPLKILKTLYIARSGVVGEPHMKYDKMTLEDALEIVREHYHLDDRGQLATNEADDDDQPPPPPSFMFSDNEPAHRKRMRLRSAQEADLMRLNALVSDEVPPSPSFMLSKPRPVVVNDAVEAEEEIEDDIYTNDSDDDSDADEQDSVPEVKRWMTRKD